jgi:hypothetical protein
MDILSKRIAHNFWSGDDVSGIYGKNKKLKLFKFLNNQKIEIWRKGLNGVVTLNNHFF